MHLVVVVQKPGSFTCKRYLDFPNGKAATVAASVSFLFSYQHISTFCQPSTSLAKQSRPPIEIQPCESHLHGIEACIGDNLNVFLTNKPNAGPACCKAITEISQDCFNGLIQPFISDFFGPYMKELRSPPPHPRSFLS
ncbi:hypothetical protein CRYUN_Cryun31cG0078100 [Craigia yunnanensis]